MNKKDVIRAWKDPVYRASLSPEELAQLPAHPARRACSSSATSSSKRGCPAA